VPIYEWGGDLVRYSVDTSYAEKWWRGWDSYIVPSVWLTSTNATTMTWDYGHRWKSNATTSMDRNEWYVLTHGDYARIEREAARTRQQSQREEQQQRSVVRTAACDRAVALLESMLSPDQMQRYRLTGAFEVIGSHGTLYRVNRGVSGNIEWIKPDGSVGGRLCAHPDMINGWLPEADVHLSQMLALMTDERSFARTANVHQGQRPALA
jgi:hypothetical protein